jgi:hypothetical protein
MKMTLTELGELLDRYATNEDMNGALMLVERPDRWYDDPHWRCVNGHINTEPVAGYRRENAQATEEWSFQLCPECHHLVRLTFPEDKPGPLSAPKEFML